MAPRVNIPHQEELVSRQLHLYEQELHRTRRVPRDARTVIHIEHEEGSGALLLARRLAHSLGWELAGNERGLDLHEAGVDPFAHSDRLRVRLVSPLSQRARRVADQLGWSTLRARRWLLQAHEEAGNEDPHAYDLVLNAEHATLEQLETIVLAALAARREAQAGT